MSIDINKVLGKGDRLLRVTDSEVANKGDYIEFSVSSEFPVREWYGYEILSHRSEAIDLKRVPGMPFFWNHGNGEIGKKPLGVVEDWRISGGKSRPVVRWANADYVQEYRQLYEDDILTCFSIGYQKLRAQEIGPASDGTPQVLVTNWEPIEVSLVPDPADPTVGKYRSLGMMEDPEEEDDEEGIEVNISVNINSEPEEEDEEEEDGEDMNTCPACGFAYKSMMKKDCKCAQGGSMGIDVAEMRSQEKERQRSIRAMGDKWGNELGPKFRELAESLIDSDKSVEEARSAFATEVERSFGKQTPLGGLNNPGQPRDYLPGFGAKEDRQYSLLRLLRSMIPAFPDEYGKPCFEREVSQQIAQQIGGDPNEIRLPTRNLGYYGQRDIQQVGSATLGGNMVGTDYRPDMWVEALRNTAVVFQLGARFITGLKGNVAFPKETGVSSASWINENDPAPETNYTVGQLSLTPKTIAAYTSLTRTLMLQSAPDAEMVARDNLLKAIALKIDQTALSGSGLAPEPKGIVNYSGIKTLTTALGSDGGYPTYAALVELFGAIEAANANINGLKWLINSKTMARLMVTPVQASGVEGNFIIKDGATSFVGLPFAVSNQCRSNLTKGNGTGLSELYLGDWSQLYVGEWEGLSLNVNYNGKTFQTGGAEIVAFQTLDMNVAHEESFAAITEVKTA
jgi:HK97 family phage major capsid protein